MITLYGMGSPNVLKVAIALEEAGLAYEDRLVSVMTGEQFTPEFLALNPVAKVPVLVDEDRAPGQPIFESGAILIYLAETYTPHLLPTEGPARWEVLKWLMVQMAWVGPMLGQNNHFLLIKEERGSYGARRYADQSARIFRDLDTRLGQVPYLAGEDYSIADIATFPWSDYLFIHRFDPAEHPNLVAWRARIDQRPAVQRARAAFAAKGPEMARLTGEATPETIDRFFARREPGPTPDFSAMMRAAAKSGNPS